MTRFQKYLRGGRNLINFKQTSRKSKLKRLLKTNSPTKFKIIEGGIEAFEATNEFKLKVAEIKRDLTDQYSLILLNERNWVRRLLIKIKREIAIGKKIQALSSLKNLHAVSYA